MRGRTREGTAAHGRARRRTPAPNATPTRQLTWNCEQPKPSTAVSGGVLRHMSRVSGTPSLSPSAASATAHGVSSNAPTQQRVTATARRMAAAGGETRRCAVVALMWRCLCCCGCCRDNSGSASGVGLLSVFRGETASYVRRVRVPSAAAADAVCREPRRRFPRAQWLLYWDFRRSLCCCRRGAGCCHPRTPPPPPTRQRSSFVCRCSCCRGSRTTDSFGRRCVSASIARPCG
jgi:hypothetical protein